MVATPASDLYLTPIAPGDESPKCALFVPGHSHEVSLWDRYALIFHSVDENAYHPFIADTLRQVADRWPDEIPSIDQVMPYIKKQIIDHSLQIIGIMAGYAADADGSPQPYVYQILGSDIRRINIDDEGNIIFGHVILEKDPLLGRFTQEVRMRNGDDWEYHPAMFLHTDVYSLTMADRVATRLLNAAMTIRHAEDAAVPPELLCRAFITPYSLNITPARNG